MGATQLAVDDYAPVDLQPRSGGKVDAWAQADSGNHQVTRDQRAIGQMGLEPTCNALQPGQYRPQMEAYP
ncbi:hypothetical protein D3C85_1543230 [compost metagenome]